MSEMLSSMLEAGVRERPWKLELLATLLLGLAAVGAGWSAYQAARWSSDQTFTLDRAWVARRKAATLQNRAYLARVLQVELFVDYLRAMRGNDSAFANFLLARFPPPLKAVTEAWLATKPLKNPQAPSSPFVMKQYQLPEEPEAMRLEEQGNTITGEARRENQISDQYVLLTVPFAIVSLFSGLSSVFESPGVRKAVLAAALAVFVGAVVVIATMPVS